MDIRLFRKTLGELGLCVVGKVEVSNNGSMSATVYDKSHNTAPAYFYHAYYIVERRELYVKRFLGFKDEKVIYQKTI